MKEYLSSLISHGKQWHLKRSKIYDELMAQILDITKNCRNDLNERVYWILNDIIDYPYCCQCNVQFQPRFYGFKNAYRDSKYCSIGCVNKSENHKSSIKVSYKERTGFEHPSQNPEFREKVDQINSEKYGDSNYFRTLDFKKKSANTNIERYGYASAMHNEEISIKNQKTQN